MRTIVDPCLVGSSVVSPVFVPSVSSSAQSQLQVSALPVSTVPPASSVTARDEDVPTPSGSPAGASSSRLAHVLLRLLITRNSFVSSFLKSN